MNFSVGSLDGAVLENVVSAMIASKWCVGTTYSAAATAGLAGALNGSAALGAGVVVVVDDRLHLES